MILDKMDDLKAAVKMVDKEEKKITRGKSHKNNKASQMYFIFLLGKNYFR